jgi:multiple sugar transport system substrate-binding protein
MTAIDISICLSRDQSSADMDVVLEPFNTSRSAGSHAHVTVIPWDVYKDELTAIAIYGKGPDISQVGAPLVNDLVVMNALRPFNNREITNFGGPSIFHTIAWQSSRRVFEGHIWAIPWLADPRAILYWKDLLNRAGVQEYTAFQNFEHMEHTFQRLQASGVDTPWVLPIGDRLQALQAACSWIWGAGGDFVSADNRLPFFHHPDSITGLKKYFGLYRYMPKEAQPLDGAHAFQLFFNRKAAVTMGNLAQTLGLLIKLPPELRSQIGVALPPGAPLVGSSSLVVWKHTRNEQDAVDTIRFLLTKDAQVKYCQKVGYLPVRNDALMEPPYATDPIFRGFAQALQKGRLFPLIKLGGLLEDKLATILSMVWADIIAGQKLDLDTTLAREFSPIVRHFEQWTG